MTDSPPDASSNEGGADPAMLAVLSNRRQRREMLSPEQERLLDDWVAGRLAPAEAAQAESLTGQNVWAAERVLERRLLDAASRRGEVPDGLSARVLAALAPAAGSATRAPWWQGLRNFWLAGLAMAAFAAILAVAVAPLFQRSFQDGGSAQIAMASIADRSALFEPADVRMRGSAAPPVPDQRFRDVEIPTAVLRDLVNATSASAAARAVGALQRYLPAGAGQALPRIALDAALKERLDGTTAERLPVRIYDLGDPRSAEVRALLGAIAEDRRYLLTVKP